MVNTGALTPEQMLMALEKNLANLAAAQEAQAKNLKQLAKIVSNSIAPIGAFAKRQEEREIKRDRKARDPAEVNISKKSIKEIRKLDISEKMDALLKEVKKQPKSNEGFFSKILGPIGVILGLVAATGFLAGKFPGVRQLLNSIKGSNVGQSLIGFVSKFNKSDKSLIEWIRSMPIIGRFVDLYEGFQLIGEGKYDEGIERLKFAIPGYKFLKELFAKGKSLLLKTFNVDEGTPLSLDLVFKKLGEFTSYIWEKLKSFVVGMFGGDDGQPSILEKIKKYVIDALFTDKEGNPSILTRIKNKIESAIEKLNLNNVIEQYIAPLIANILNGIDFSGKMEQFMSNVVQPFINRLIGPETAVGFIIQRVKELFAGDITKERLLEFLGKLSERFPALSKLANFVEQLFNLSLDGVINRAIEAIMSKLPDNLNLDKILDGIVNDLGGKISPDMDIGGKISQTVEGIKSKIGGIYNKVNTILTNIVDIFGAIANMMSEDPAKYAQGKAFLQANAPGLATLFDGVMSVIHAITDIFGGQDLDQSLKKYGINIDFKAIFDRLGANITKMFEDGSSFRKWIDAAIDKQIKAFSDAMTTQLDKTVKAKADELYNNLVNDAYRISKSVFSALMDAVWEKIKKAPGALKNWVSAKLFGSKDQAPQPSVTGGLDEDNLKIGNEQPTIIQSDINKAWLEDQFEKIVSGICACTGKERGVEKAKVKIVEDVKPSAKPSGGNAEKSTKTAEPTKQETPKVEPEEETPRGVDATLSEKEPEPEPAKQPEPEPAKQQESVTEQVAKTNVTTEYSQEAGRLFSKASDLIDTADELAQSKDREELQQAIDRYDDAHYTLKEIMDKYPGFRTGDVKEKDNWSQRQIGLLLDELSPEINAPKPEETQGTINLTPSYSDINNVKPDYKPAIADTSEATVANDATINKEMVKTLKSIDMRLQEGNKINNQGFAAVASADKPAPQMLNVNANRNVVLNSGGSSTGSFRAAALNSPYANVV